MVEGGGGGCLGRPFLYRALTMTRHLCYYHSCFGCLWSPFGWKFSAVGNWIFMDRCLAVLTVWFDFGRLGRLGRCQLESLLSWKCTHDFGPLRTRRKQTMALASRVEPGESYRWIWQRTDFTSLIKPEELINRRTYTDRQIFGSSVPQVAVSIQSKSSSREVSIRVPVFCVLF